MLRRDFKGQLLCEKCWNGAHYEHKTNKITGRKTSVKISLCLQGGCECHCRELLAEKEKEREKMKEQEKEKIEELVQRTRSRAAKVVA